jgi:mono/diheme cytochrome c family protein
MPLGLKLPRMSRSALGVCALFLALAGAVGTKVALGDTSAAPNQATAQAASGGQAALIARGKYLTDAADCYVCHTGNGSQPFSGGLQFKTPFGILYSPNITPDKVTGIGNWSDKDFWNALHYGISPGHSFLIFPKFLYPAMTFTSYTKLSYPDVMAIKAYLFSLKPVYAPAVPNALNFPFNIRPMLLGWRILFFRAGGMKYDPSWNQDIRNGAYLTEALGHCTECHTPRNIIGGLINDRSLAGAQVDAYYAPNISSDKTDGVGGWSRDELVSYLYQGGNMTKGSAFGPMGQVVQYSLSKLPKSDIEDIASYLQTVTPPRKNEQVPMMALTASDAALGAKVYAANCAACHMPTGTGMAPMIPPLKGNDSVTAAQPDNVIGAVLNGLQPWNNGPPMPSFATALSDREIAAVTNYVRTTWGNAGSANATPAKVMADRNVADVPPMGGMAADQFGCPRVSAAGGDGALADPGGGILDLMNGATAETLPNRTRAMIAALRKSNPSMTDATVTNYLVAAYCPVVANESGMSRSEKQKALDSYIASVQPLIHAPVRKGS